MTGQRKSVKILGAIELFQTRFHYRQETVFNASTYLSFLEQLARRYRRQGAILIQDNASPTTKTAMSGPGSAPIDTGWKCISCRLTPPSSTLPNDFGSTRGGRELTTGTSLTLPSYSPHSRVSLVRCNLIRS